ncbi:MAG: zinc ABC transporter ATP-binding protein ZnuC [Minwuiales bacterium]|nr:zinc ABC transporter ATP-binding protein ZnuC [Minwuiales bacterium]
MLVEAKGVTVSYRGRAVLDHVDVSVGRGEIVTLIGPNGSGKSTLIRVLLGLTRPSSGVAWRDRDVRIGYVPQHLQLDKALPLTARRFLSLPGRAGADAIRAVAAEVGAEDLLDRQFQDLSGGEMKRVMLARALLRDPDLLVLDEPTANVDVTGQAEFYDLIRAIRDRRKCGVLVVSHDLHLVMAATDRVVCLNGHVCCHGAPAHVSRHPEYLALFGPRLGSTFAIYSHDHDHRHDLAGEPVADPPENGS